MNNRLLALNFSPGNVGFMMFKNYRESNWFRQLDFDYDNPIELHIKFDLAGKVMNRNFFRYLLRVESVKVINHWYETTDDLERLYPVELIVLFCVSHMRPDRAFSVLQTIEKKHPGTIARTRDAYGRSVLDYAAQQSHSSEILINWIKSLAQDYPTLRSLP